VTLLEVEDLRVTFPTEDGLVHAVDGISYSIDTGQTLGIVGESGSGKSVSSLTTLGLTRTQGAKVEGKMMFEGDDLIQMNDNQLRQIRGNSIAMIFQDPLSSLHPFYRVGAQLVEAVLTHRNVSKKAARDRAIELLDLVRIPDPERRVDAYPHEFSGGMRQRAMIAMALANEPKLLIADEPTTALDVTVQAQILALLEDLQKQLGMAIIIITHDLGVVAEIADDIAVMYSGRIVEHATTTRIFAEPQHPYTWGLLKSIPRLDTPAGDELVPITGRPPSLINRPPGCHFHPRCPYVLDSHKRVDPRLEPVATGDEHEVACLLSTDVRMRIWRGLAEGRTPGELRRLVGDSNGAPVAMEAEPLLSEEADEGDDGIQLEPPDETPPTDHTQGMGTA
jgi:peptide/nickel transport system ATP-binding protein